MSLASDIAYSLGHALPTALLAFPITFLVMRRNKPVRLKGWRALAALVLALLGIAVSQSVLAAVFGSGLIVDWGGLLAAPVLISLSAIHAFGEGASCALSPAEKMRQARPSRPPV